MGETKYAERNDAIDFYFLIAKHLDRMSETLRPGLETDPNKNTGNLIAYYMATAHYENMITMFLPNYYWEKKKNIFPKIPPVSDTWGDVYGCLNFFEAVNQWFQLIHTTAYNEGVLKIRRPYKKEEAGAVYKNGYKPSEIEEP